MVASSRTVTLSAALTLGLALGACGGGPTGGSVPEPALAGSRDAQTRFRRIEARFEDLPDERRGTLEPDLRGFLRAHPADGHARQARLYLAWIEIGRRRLTEAEALAKAARVGPPGAVHDFADVTTAAVLRRTKRVDRALTLLEPLRGKLANPFERALHAEELVRSLVEAERFAEAIGAMLDWAEQAAQTEREAAVAAIEALVRGMPVAALEAGLGTLTQQEEEESGSSRTTRAEARRWLAQVVETRLVRAALMDRDANLARRLLDRPASRASHGESREALSTLAQSGAVAARVAGRAVGVLLDVSDDVTRRRSAEVIRGMTRALGLPDSASRPDAVRLLTRDASEPGDVDRALSALAGDGAAILVAGVTDEGAVAASLFAERTHTPVIVLRTTPAGGPPSPFTFVAGAEPAAEQAALSEATDAAGVRSVVRVGPGGAPCDARPAASESRFPVAAWKAVQADAVVVEGDAACARDVALEAASVKWAPLFVLGLEAADVKDALPERLAVVTAGRFPFGLAPEADDERSFVARWGTAPTWYMTLGRDAALLAATVLRAFPLERVDDAQAVEQLHLRARDALSQVRVTLWSTSARGFSGRTVLPRELRGIVLEAAKPGPR